MFQMEHLRYLSELISTRNYDFALFADDDDTYALDRVQSFDDEWTRYLSRGQPSSDVWGLMEFSDENTQLFLTNRSMSPVAHWLYAIKPAFLEQFFMYFRYYSDLLQCVYSDLMLDFWLTNGQRSGTHVLGVKGQRYEYNRANSESIMANVDRESAADSITRAIICGSGELLDKVRARYSITNDDLVRYVPNLERYARMVECLYRRSHINTPVRVR